MKSTLLIFLSQTDILLRIIFMNLKLKLKHQDLPWCFCFCSLPYFKSVDVIPLIGITSTAASFVSYPFDGIVSDKGMTLRSGLLGLLEPADAVMADKF